MRAGVMLRYVAVCIDVYAPERTRYCRMRQAAFCCARFRARVTLLRAASLRHESHVVTLVMLTMLLPRFMMPPLLRKHGAADVSRALFIAAESAAEDSATLCHMRFCLMLAHTPFHDFYAIRGATYLHTQHVATICRCSLRQRLRC